MEAALQLAEFAQESNTEAEIRFYTDTAYEYTDGIRIVDMTDGEWNAAAIGLDAAENGGIWNFTGHIAIYGGDATINASLYVDGEYVSIKKVDCKDGEVTTVDFRDYEAYNFQIAQLLLEVPEGESDALIEDNTYSFYNTISERKTVQLAFGPNKKDEFLNSALRSIKNVNVSSIQIDNLENGAYEKLTDSFGNKTPSKLKSTGYDLYIYVGILPREMPADGAVWILDPPQMINDEGSNTIVEMPEEISLGFERVHTYPISEGKEGQTKGYSLIANTLLDSRFSSFTQGLSLEDVKVGEYAPIVLEENSVYVPLLFCDEEDVVMVGGIGENHRRVLVMSIAASNLSTRMADYILLISNMMAFSCPDFIDDNAYNVGETATLVMPAGATQVTISRDGEVVNVVDAADMTYTFDTPGNYTFEIALTRTVNGEEVTEQTENLYCFARIAEQDSNIYGEEPSLEAFPLPEGLVTEFEPVEIWQYFLIALLIILTAEWWVYYRA